MDDLLPPEPPFQPFRLGRYQVFMPLGVGGMGKVFLAEQQGAQGFAKVVVIKLMHEEQGMNQRLVHMFVDEAHVMSALHHPNVVDILELQEDGKRLYMALEYVDGLDLLRLQSAMHSVGERLEVPMVLHIACAVLAGLAHAHDATGIDDEPLDLVHRDVTPGNILISRQGHVKLSDFGVARARGRLSETLAGEVKGKLHSLAPELLQGARATSKADIFSAGVLLWEALTDQRLFNGKSDFHVMEAVLRGPIPAPSSVNPAIPDGLDAVVLSALERDPSKRIASARELRHELMRFTPAEEMDRRQQELATMVNRFAPPKRSVSSARLKIVQATETLSRGLARLPMDGDIDVDIEAALAPIHGETPSSPPASATAPTAPPAPAPARGTPAPFPTPVAPAPSPVGATKPVAPAPRQNTPAVAAPAPIPPSRSAPAPIDVPGMAPAPRSPTPGQPVPGPPAPMPARVGPFGAPPSTVAGVPAAPARGIPVAAPVTGVPADPGALGGQGPLASHPLLVPPAPGELGFVLGNGPQFVGPVSPQGVVNMLCRLDRVQGLTLGTTPDAMVPAGDYSQRMLLDHLVRPRWLAPLPTQSGTLAQVGVGRMLASASLNRLSGMLLLQQEGAMLPRAAFFREGCLQYVFDPQPDEHLVTLYMRHQPPGTNLGEILSLVLGGMTLDLALQRAGGLNADHVRAAISTLSRDRLLAPLRDARTRFVFHAAVAPPYPLAPSQERVLGVLPRLLDAVSQPPEVVAMAERLLERALALSITDTAALADLEVMNEMPIISDMLGYLQPRAAWDGAAPPGSPAQYRLARALVLLEQAGMLG